MKILSTTDTFDSLWQALKYLYFLVGFYLTVLFGGDDGDPPAGGAGQLAFPFMYESKEVAYA